MFEELPNQENPNALRERVIEAIRSRSVEAQGLINAWTMLKEEEVKNSPKAEQPRVQTSFELERAEIYIAIDDEGGARGALIHTYIMTLREGLVDLMDRAQSLADLLGIGNLHEEAMRFVG